MQATSGSLVVFALDVHPTVAAAIVAAVTSLFTTVVLRYFVDVGIARRKAESDYEYEQRKELRRLVGRYDGPLVEAAADLHYRLMNLYVNVDHHWHKSYHGDYASSGYYLRTTVYRFLALMRLAVQFEAAALYLDSRIASTTERDFALFVKALQWVLSDVRLYDNLGYDAGVGTDHFLRDELRTVCAVDPPEGGRFDLKYFDACVASKRDFEPLFVFFDDISPAAQPLRWDRVVCFHLVLLAFMNAVGYDDGHKTDAAGFEQVAEQIRNRVVKDNFCAWLAANRLDRHKEVRAICNAVSRA